MHDILLEQICNDHQQTHQTGCEEDHEHGAVKSQILGNKSKSHSIVVQVENSVVPLQEYLSCDKGTGCRCMPARGHTSQQCPHTEARLLVGLIFQEARGRQAVEHTWRAGRGGHPNGLSTKKQPKIVSNAKIDSSPGDSPVGTPGQSPSRREGGTEYPAQGGGWVGSWLAPNAGPMARASLPLQYSWVPTSGCLVSQPPSLLRVPKPHQGAGEREMPPCPCVFSTCRGAWGGGGAQGTGSGHSGAPWFFSRGLWSSCWLVCVAGGGGARCSGPSSKAGEPYTTGAGGVCGLGDLQLEGCTGRVV